MADEISIQQIAQLVLLRGVPIFVGRELRESRRLPRLAIHKVAQDFKKRGFHI